MFLLRLKQITLHREMRKKCSSYAMRVSNTLWLSRRTRAIDNESRMIKLDLFKLQRLIIGFCEESIPRNGLFESVEIVGKTVDPRDNHQLGKEIRVDGVDNRLEFINLRDDLAVVQSAVIGKDQFWTDLK
jgi:hypothetical protein